MGGYTISAVSPANAAAAAQRVQNPGGGAERSFREVLVERAASPAPALAKAGPTAAVRQAMEQLDAGSRALDRILELARQGRRFSPQELLVLQAEVYRFSEQAALVTKVAEQAASGLKRLWQLQV